MNQMNKLSFGVSAVVSGMRKVTYNPELVALSTAGGFRITPEISKALGIQHGDNVTFVKNVDQVEQAIISRDAAYVDWCNNSGYDPATAEAATAFHKEYDFWGIVKGYPLFNDKGVALTVSERMTKAEKESYVEDHFDDMLEAAQTSGSEALLASLEAAGDDHTAVVKVLATAFNPEKPKYSGSKAANSSNMLGTGVVLTFTDSNVWNQLANGKDVKALRAFPIDIDAIVKISVYNGCEEIEVDCLPFDPTVYEDKAVARIGKGSEDAE